MSQSADETELEDISLEPIEDQKHGTRLLRWRPDGQVAPALPREPGKGALGLVWRDTKGMSHVHMLGEAPLVMGRSRQCDVTLDGALISRQHAKFTRRGGGVWVEDIGSSNGTRVSGRRLAPGEPMPVAPGAEVYVGDCRVMVEMIDVAATQGIVPVVPGAQAAADEAAAQVPSETHPLPAHGRASVLQMLPAGLPAGFPLKFAPLLADLQSIVSQFQMSPRLMSRRLADRLRQEEGYFKGVGVVSRDRQGRCALLPEAGALCQMQMQILDGQVIERVLTRGTVVLAESLTH